MSCEYIHSCIIKCKNPKRENYSFCEDHLYQNKVKICSFKEPSGKETCKNSRFGDSKYCSIHNCSSCGKLRPDHISRSPFSLLFITKNVGCCCDNNNSIKKNN